VGLGSAAVAFAAVRAEVPYEPDERTYAAPLPAGDELSAHTGHVDITGRVSSDLTQAIVPLSSDGPLYSLTLALVTLVIGTLGLFACWFLLSPSGWLSWSRPRHLMVAAWAALALIADAFLVLWLLVWLGGPYWLHPLLWLLTVVPGAVVSAVVLRRKGACA
jgi:fatty acid desaturase